MAEMAGTTSASGFATLVEAWPRTSWRRIFDPFFTTKGDGGTGLGVPQVQALMNRVHGYVTVDSAVGKGTAFDLFFPVQNEPPSLAPEVAQQLDQWADEGGAFAKRAVSDVRS